MTRISHPENAQPTHHLAGWRLSPVSVLSRTDVERAQAADLPWPALQLHANMITAGLAARYGLDPELARRAFGADILAAVAVAAHKRRPAYVTRQVRQIEHFLSQSPVRNRLAWHPPAPLVPPVWQVVGFNADGSTIYGRTA